MPKGRGFKMSGGKVVWPGFSEVAQRRIAKVGRNDACPCGSGRKYKDCHESKGEEYLAKLAQHRDAKGEAARGVPWYRRLFGKR